MSNPERGPWGRSAEALDTMHMPGVGLEDGPFIESVLKSLLDQLIRLAQERRIDFSGRLKSGLPGVLSIAQKTGDVYQLYDRASEMVAMLNKLEEVRNRGMRFDVHYEPVSKKVPTPEIIISAFTSR